jgi:hypothetical protein
MTKIPSDDASLAEQIRDKGNLIRLMPDVLRELADGLPIARGHKSILNHAALMLELLSRQVQIDHPGALDDPDDDPDESQDPAPAP